LLLQSWRLQFDPKLMLTWEKVDVILTVKNALYQIVSVRTDAGRTAFAKRAGPTVNPGPSNGKVEISMHSEASVRVGKNDLRSRVNIYNSIIPTTDLNTCSGNRTASGTVYNSTRNIEYASLRTEQ
jgi:hypothetical protein